MKTLLALIGLIVLILIGLTYRTQKSADQALFLLGKVPNPLPDGLFKGTAEYTGSWIGKNFNASTTEGINLFKNANGTVTEKYPFKTSIGKGIRDTNLDVIKIDYNIPNNPFWLRSVLDEMVEVAPGKYLGKVHLRLGTLFSVAIGYFRLEK